MAQENGSVKQTPNAKCVVQKVAHQIWCTTVSIASLITMGVANIAIQEGSRKFRCLMVALTVLVICTALDITARIAVLVRKAWYVEGFPLMVYQT